MRKGADEVIDDEKRVTIKRAYNRGSLPMKAENQAVMLIGALMFGLSPSQVVAQSGSVPEAAVSLQCGGIGKDESERLLAEAGMHALMILFVAADGSYLTDIETYIDAPLNGLRTEARCGPVGLVDVPSSGRYRVSARYNGNTQERWVVLKPRGAARMELRWTQ